MSSQQQQQKSYKTLFNAISFISQNYKKFISIEDDPIINFLQDFWKKGCK